VRKTHIALRNVAEYVIRSACGRDIFERDGLHSWLDGDSRFWGTDFERVDCKRCLRARENYLARKVVGRIAPVGRLQCN
jgi:hypothetical protein